MYTLSFVVMVGVSLIAAGITSKLKKRVDSEKIQAKKMEMLYNTDAITAKAYPSVILAVKIAANT